MSSISGMSGEMSQVGDQESEAMAGSNAPRERRKAIRFSADAVRAREQAREEERKRLARELHDDLGQAMTGLKMDLAWLERRVLDAPDGAPSSDEVHAKLQMMSQIVNQCIHTLRSVITELRPQTLDQLGLIPSIEWQVDTFGRRFGLRTSFTTSVESVPIDMGRATAVFRMFQEMLTNVARHANASRINVTVDVDGNTLILTVQDNGRGVTSKQPAASSTGILGMRERASLLGGELDVVSRPQQGTTVVVRIPMENRRRTPRVSERRARS
jgi:signal transduction histidine kinase